MTPDPLQIEFSDMRVRLLATLMTEDDAEGADRAKEAVDECLANVMRYNYQLYAGGDGVPPASQLDPGEVGTTRVSLLREGLSGG